MVFQPDVISQEIAVPVNHQSELERQSSTWPAKPPGSVQLDVTLLPQQASGPRSATSHALVYNGTAAFIIEDTTPVDLASYRPMQTRAWPAQHDPLEIRAQALDLDTNQV